MKLQRVLLSDWRNAGCVEIAPDPRVTVLWGVNGAGKTNVLEGIAVLANLASFRSASWSEVPRWDTARAVVAGTVEGAAGTARLRVQVQDGGRQAFVDGEAVADPARYFRHLRAVVFCPEDTAMIRGEPERRRRFLDRATFNRWPGHLKRVRDFRRALAQKGALLRSGNAKIAEVEAWNGRLAELGAAVVAGRNRFVDAVQEPLARLHQELASGLSARLRYRGVLGEGDEPTLSARYRQRLDGCLEEEIRRGLHLVGPHRDDLEILYEAPSGAPDDPREASLRSARTYGSQGQVRTLALALKLAELAVAGSEGDPPLLLLDDLSSELDGGRLARLVQHLLGLETQIFVTTTDPGPILRNLSGLGLPVHLDAGAVAGTLHGG